MVIDFDNAGGIVGVCGCHNVAVRYLWIFVSLQLFTISLPLLFYVLDVLFFVALLLVVLGAKSHGSGLLLYHAVSPRIHGKPWEKFAALLVIGQLCSVGCSGPEERGIFLGGTRSLEEMPQLLEVALGNRNWRWEAIPFPPSALVYAFYPMYHFAWTVRCSHFTKETTRVQLS